MEEAPENDKESSYSAKSNGMNKWIDNQQFPRGFKHTMNQCCYKSWCVHIRNIACILHSWALSSLPLLCKTSWYGMAGIQLTENVEQALIPVQLHKKLHSAKINWNLLLNLLCYPHKNHNSQFHYCLFTLMFLVHTVTVYFSSDCKTQWHMCAAS
jgi:hypothetical protein